SYGGSERQPHGGFWIVSPGSEYSTRDRSTDPRLLLEPGAASSHFPPDDSLAQEFDQMVLNVIALADVSGPYALRNFGNLPRSSPHICKKARCGSRIEGSGHSHSLLHQGIGKNAP